MNMTTVPSDKLKDLQAENATLKAELLSAGTARQELMNDNLRFVEEIAALKEQLSERNRVIDALKNSWATETDALKAQVAQLKTVPMKYRRMTFNAQLQEENAELSKQLAIPSPEILDARDQRVIAEYLASMSHKESGE